MGCVCALTNGLVHMASYSNGVIHLGPMMAERCATIRVDLNMASLSKLSRGPHAVCKLILILDIFRHRVMYHLFCSCPDSTPYILPISRQYTISPAHVLSVHHLSCPCPFRTLSLLPMSFQYTISPAHVLSVHHLSCPPSHLAVSSQNNLSLSCLCPDSIKSVLHIFSVHK